MTERTIHGTVVALKNGVYTVYVFQDDESNYHMCTKLPNWGSEYHLNIGDSGFLTMQEFLGGEQYYDRNTDFKDFIKDSNYETKDIIL